MIPRKWDLVDFSVSRYFRPKLRRLEYPSEERIVNLGGDPVAQRGERFYAPPVASGEGRAVSEDMGGALFPDTPGNSGGGTAPNPKA